MQFNLNLTREELETHLNDLRQGLGGSVANAIADEMERQMPGLPVPTARQAIVRTRSGVWIHADTKDSSGLPWMVAKNDSSYDWEKEPTEKIVEIIHPGQEA